MREAKALFGKRGWFQGCPENTRPGRLKSTERCLRPCPSERLILSNRSPRTFLQDRRAVLDCSVFRIDRGHLLTLGPYPV